MGLGLRVFLVEDDDSLKRITLARYKRLLLRQPEASMPQYAEKRVRCALVVVEFVSRRPAEIVHIQYSLISFD